MMSQAMLESVNQAATIRALWNRLDEIDGSGCDVFSEVEGEYVTEQVDKLPGWLTYDDAAKEAAEEACRDWHFQDEMYNLPDEVLDKLEEAFREALSEAGDTGPEPLHFPTEEDVSFDRLTAIPNLGGFEPEGFTEIDSHFTDKSGWGSRWEPALTLDQLRDAVIENIREHGPVYLALSDEGQFQIYVKVFTKD
jgi:hypothetical protein